MSFPIPVDQSRLGQMEGRTVSAVLFNNEHQTNSEGVPRWTIHALVEVRDRWSGQMGEETIEVTMVSPTPPQVTKGQPITFEELTVTSGLTQKGRFFESWSCVGFNQPSAQRRGGE